MNLRTLPEMKDVGVYLNGLSFTRQGAKAYLAEEVIQSLEGLIARYEQVFAAMQRSYNEELALAYEQGKQAAQVEFAEEKKRLRVEVERIILTRLNTASEREGGAHRETTSHPCTNPVWRS